MPLTRRMPRSSPSCAVPARLALPPTSLQAQVLEGVRLCEDLLPDLKPRRRHQQRQHKKLFSEMLQLQRLRGWRRRNDTVTMGWPTLEVSSLPSLALMMESNAGCKL